MGNMRVLSVVPRNPASPNHLPPNRKEANESISVFVGAANVTAF